MRADTDNFKPFARLLRTIKPHFCTIKPHSSLDLCLLSANSLQIVNTRNATFNTCTLVFYTLHADFPFDGFSLECCRSMVALYDVRFAPIAHPFA